MINLIPPTAKKQVVHDYYLRVGALALFVITVLCVAYSLFLLPTLLVIQAQYAVIGPQQKLAAEESIAFTTAVTAVEEANTLASLLAVRQQVPPILELINNVQSLTNGTIMIGQIAAAREEDFSVSSLAISGEATTRAALAAFRDRLEADARFENVVLPLANLAKDVEVPFSITLTVINEDIEL